eukprot:1055079-Pyramimonas_sp.AAC.1
MGRPSVSMTPLRTSSRLEPSSAPRRISCNPAMPGCFLSAAVLGSGAPRLGNLPEEPLRGALAPPPERYTPPSDVRQRWKGVVVDCVVRVLPGSAQAECPHDRGP